MPYGDGIPLTHCFSLTDFHEYKSCPFRFFVKHHLGKKYELDEASEQMALGTLLDESIKLFHQSKAYGQPSDYLQNLVKAARAKILAKLSRQRTPSFYSSIAEFLTDGLCEKATEVFRNYYIGVGQKIKPSLGPVGFCEWVIKGGEDVGGRALTYKVWGGPDALELGDDGLPEVVDYKSREALAFGPSQDHKSREALAKDAQRAKNNLDMELMPKMYTLLCAEKLLKLGYRRARFVVRFWQDPKEAGFFEEFDLGMIKNFEVELKRLIEGILNTTEIKFCEKSYCKACSGVQRDQYILELQKLGLIMSPAAVAGSDSSVDAVN